MNPLPNRPTHSPRPAGHPDWCAGGHHCQLGEHRSHPIRVDLTGTGSILLTRVQAGDGHQYAEIRASLRLGDDDTTARGRLSHLLGDLTHLMRTTRHTPLTTY